MITNSDIKQYLTEIFYLQEDALGQLKKENCGQNTDYELQPF